VDDGSPDRCGEICDNYRLSDHRIMVIHKENGGLSDARNAGLHVASGDFITFIDSDDWVNENYLERLHFLLTSTGSDISICGYLKVTSDNPVASSTNHKIHEFDSQSILDCYATEFMTNLIIAWGKLYKAALFETIRFPVGKLHEDEYVSHHLLYKAKKTVISSEPLYFYFSRDDSITGVHRHMKNIECTVEAYLDRTRFLNKVGKKQMSDWTLSFLYSFVFDFYQQNKNKFSLPDRKRYRKCLKEMSNDIYLSRLSWKLKLYYAYFYLIKSHY
jgi:glycosyltransferase involved in cell wall biosynthesis